ncbi:MAG TPA: hypothetical protein VHS28_00830, partial [Chloroflexota bacterium]|nr:hypothetical protein [Chloroflexota bacterium]
SAVIVFLFWLYIAHMIVLFGAELTYVNVLESRGIREPGDAPCAEGGGGSPPRRWRQGGEGGVGSSEVRLFDAWPPALEAVHPLVRHLLRRIEDERDPLRLLLRCRPRISRGRRECNY